MSEFEKELENNMKLRKIAYERESIDSDYFVSKWDIERIFHDWHPPKTLVVVPQIVADFIEVRKKSLKLYDAFQEIEECYCGDLYNFVCQKRNGQDLFARAWLDGYTVEKEQLYVLEFPNRTNPYVYYLKSNMITQQCSQIEDAKRFTESEIKAIDERYWAFAVKVD